MDAHVADALLAFLKTSLVVDFIKAKVRVSLAQVSPVELGHLLGRDGRPDLVALACLILFLLGFSYAERGHVLDHFVPSSSVVH